VIPLSTVHGWTGHSSRERLIYYPADKRLLAWFPQLVAVSNDIRNELIRHGAAPTAVTTLLNGIDHRHFRRNHARSAGIRRQLGLADDQIVVGAVGRAEPQKRFDLLIEAYAQIRRDISQLRLMIVGDGSVRPQLEAQIVRLGLEDGCLMLGHRTDIVDLHHAMDLFVQSSDYEGTPNAVLEAMAMETPIVATDVGGTAELARSHVDAIILAPGDAGLLAQSIRSALKDPGGAAARARSARQRVETVLSFDARMGALERIYVELFERRAPARSAPAVARP
jgi:glycosyltransferase involved in cell wall biosynthesis